MKLWRRIWIGVRGLIQCPACGYWAFNGIECFDCGYRSQGNKT